MPGYDLCFFFPYIMPRNLISRNYAQKIYVREINLNSAPMKCDRELWPGRNYPGNMPTKIIFMKHPRVVFLYNMPKTFMRGKYVQKLYAREIWPNYTCPRAMPHSIMQGMNVQKLYPRRMSENVMPEIYVKNDNTR